MDLPQRQQLIAQLDANPACGVRSLQHVLPTIARNTAADFVRRYHSLRNKRRRRRLCSLEWHVPGAVWAIDGTWLPWPTPGQGRRALVIVDLGARCVLHCQPIPGERADAVIACLAATVARAGTPLVIKWDNGSGFVAADVQSWCKDRGITLLHSPVRRPSYNGACEVHNRWAKVRMVRAAGAAGHEGQLLPEDLRAACTPNAYAAALPDTLRSHFTAAVERHRAAVRVERGLAPAPNAGHAPSRSSERVAVRRALEQCHILTIRGRDYRW